MPYRLSRPVTAARRSPPKGPRPARAPSTMAMPKSGGKGPLASGPRPAGRPSRRERSSCASPGPPGQVAVQPSADPVAHAHGQRAVIALCVVHSYLRELERREARAPGHGRAPPLPGRGRPGRGHVPSATLRPAGRPAPRVPQRPPGRLRPIPPETPAACSSGRQPHEAGRPPRPGHRRDEEPRGRLVGRAHRAPLGRRP